MVAGELERAFEGGYLHDAEVLGLDYRVSAEGDREIVVRVACHPDAGHPAWDGQRLTIRLRDVLVANWRLIGGQMGRETIDRWDAILSDVMFHEEQRMRDGLTRWGDGTRFAVSFHSGASLEGVCRELVVEPSER